MGLDRGKKLGNFEWVTNWSLEKKRRSHREQLVTQGETIKPGTETTGSEPGPLIG